MGNAVYVKQDFWPLNTSLYVTDFKGNDPLWVFHVLDRIDFSGFDSGSVQPMLNRNYIAEIPVEVPPLPEQRQIAAALQALDDLIDVNRTQAELLIQLARAKYDALRATASDVTSFDSTVRILTGGTPKTSEPSYWGGSIPWFSVADAPQGGNPWVLATAKSVTDSGVANSAAQVLPIGATIISARGTVGKLAVVGTPMAMNQSCYALQSKLGDHGVYGYFAAEQVVEALRQRAHGTVFDTITRESLARVEVERIPASSVALYEAVAGPLFDLARDLTVEVLDLVRVREGLIGLLMSGKVRVRAGATAREV